MKSGLELDLVERTIKTTGVVLLVCLPFGLYYLGVYPTLAVFSGGVWGIVNFIFLSAVIRSAIRPEGADGRRLVLFALIKFPLLYLSGYFLLKVPMFNPLHLLIGFSITLAVMVLKVAGRLLLGLDSEEQKDKNLQRAI